MMKAARRVIFNTGITYVRLLITVGITLYTTRLVLNSLGEVDYGIYNLIAGIVALLAFLNSAMSTSTQRFLSFYQGKGNLKLLKIVFLNSLLIHIAIAVIIVFVLEILSFFLFNGFLNIPLEKIKTAKWTYQLMIFTVFFTIISVPFTGLLNAHENMLWLALVSTIEILLKLGTALLLFYINKDRLIFYSLLIGGISVVSFVLYMIFCVKKYLECTFDLAYRSISMSKKLTSFAGWNLFGALCGISKNQGIAIILNLFYGTVINTAYGIANQISGQMSFFSNSLLRALNPQIMKSEGSNNRHRMLNLSMLASKYGFFLMAIVGIPCIFEMSTILKLWLKNVPDHTVTFCIWMIIAILTNQLTIGLQSAIQATGKIKNYQVVVGSIILLNIPTAYLLLYFNYPVYYVIMSFVIIEGIACFFRMIFAQTYADLSIKEYLKKVFLKELIPVLMNILICWAITWYFNFKFRLFLTLFCSFIFFIISIYLFGMSKEEKKIMISLIINAKEKLC